MDCVVSSPVNGQNVSVSDRGGADNFDNFLRSDDAETYTCDAFDSARTGSATVEVSIVGKLSCITVYCLKIRHLYFFGTP